jgi:serine O-acetyltransferase
MSRRYKEAEIRLAVPPVDAWGRRNENPPGMSLWQLLREDLRTHGGNPFEQGFWALAVHRFGNWRMDLPKIFRAPCTLIYFVLEKMVQVFAGIALPYVVKVGRRVRIWHFGGMILGARYIGNDVHIRQNVSMGVAQTWNLQAPIIDDGVHFGAGAAVLGQVLVGREVRIAANSLVISDVRDYATVMGIPARVLSYRVKTMRTLDEIASDRPPPARAMASEPVTIECDPDRSATQTPNT